MAELESRWLVSNRGPEAVGGADNRAGDALPSQTGYFLSEGRAPQGPVIRKASACPFGLAQAVYTIQLPPTAVSPSTARRARLTAAASKAKSAATLICPRTRA